MQPAKSGNAVAASQEYFERTGSIGNVVGKKCEKRQAVVVFASEKKFKAEEHLLLLDLPAAARLTQYFFGAKYRISGRLMEGELGKPETLSS
jgi:hypothetical protein